MSNIDVNQKTIIKSSVGTTTKIASFLMLLAGAIAVLMGIMQSLEEFLIGALIVFAGILTIVLAIFIRKANKIIWIITVALYSLNVVGGIITKLYPFAIGQVLILVLLLIDAKSFIKKPANDVIANKF